EPTGWRPPHCELLKYCASQIAIRILVLTLALSISSWRSSAAVPLQRGTVRERIQQRAGQRKGERGNSALPTQTTRIAGIDVAAWKPPIPAGVDAPLILFSHGFHGCNTQSTFLMS